MSRGITIAILVAIFMLVAAISMLTRAGAMSCSTYCRRLCEVNGCSAAQLEQCIRNCQGGVCHEDKED